MSYAAVPLSLPEHREPLARIWAENMSDARIAASIPARMRWLYELAPEGGAVTMLAVVAETGEPVGCGSILPRTTWLSGRRVRAGVLCDFAVVRAHRNAGAALTVQRALAGAGRAAGLQLVYGYPNQKSLAVFKRLGYEVVGNVANWVKPLRSGYRLRTMLPWGWLAKAAAVPVDLGLRALDAARGLRTPRLPGAVEPVPDARVDALWESARAGHALVGERSSSYLAWRYGRFPTLEHQSFLVARPGADRLSGYAVFAVEDGRASVRDVLVAPGSGAAEALLAGLTEHLRARGVQSISISYLGGPEFADQLRKAGFVRRGGERTLILDAAGLEPDARAGVLDPARWYMLDGELDI